MRNYIEKEREFYRVILENENVLPKAKWRIEKGEIKEVYRSPEGEVLQVVDTDNRVYPWKEYGSKFIFEKETAIRECKRLNELLEEAQEEINQIKRVRMLKNDADSLFENEDSIWMDLTASVDLRYEFKKDAREAGYKFYGGEPIKEDSYIRSLMAARRDKTIAFVSATVMQMRNHPGFRKVIDYRMWVEGEEHIQS